MSKLDAQEILNALPTEYHLVDLTSKKVIQSNNPDISPGTACYKAIYNKELPCEPHREKCICAESISKHKSSEFIVEKDYSAGKKFFRVKGRMLEGNLALLSYDEVTEHMLLLQEVEKNKKRLERAEHLANFGYWELDAETDLISPSKGAMLMYGIDKPRIKLSEVEGYTLPAYKDIFRVSLMNLVEHGTPFDIKYQIRRPSDGAIRHIHAIADFRLPNGNGYGIVHDITEKVEAHDAIVENEAYLQQLFRNMNSAFAQHKIICNEKGDPVDYIFLDVNPKFEELTGLKKEDILNRSVKEVLPQTEHYWIERYGKVALTGIPDEFMEYAASMDKYYEVSAFSPKKNYFATSFSDVTERQKAIKALEDAKEKAIESDRLKTLFLANMSHEIRTPLNGILGFSNILATEELEPKQKAYFGQIIENSGNRLTTVIDDIINISMIQSNQLKINYTEFDILELLDELYVVYKGQYAEKLNKVDLKLRSGESGHRGIICSDKNRVYQILKNLLDNAFKFTSEGSIEFGVLEQNEDEIKLFVRDTGIGIDDKKKDLIFQSFRQIEEGQARNYDGSGLGLAIVSGLLDKMEGSISLESELGTGAEFVVTVPDRSKYDCMKQGAGSEEKVIALKTKDVKRIVSFEDDPPSVELMQVVLDNLGYELVNFVYPSEGIAFLKKNKVDMVFMDVGLPEMNGYEATETIKEQFPEIPVIIQTAFAMEEDKAKALSSKCDDYIAKPLSRSKLEKLICKFLEGES